MSHEAYVRLVGVTFKNEDKKSRQDLLGAIYDDYWTEGEEDEVKLCLRREPKNPYDPNAIGVYCTAPSEAEGRLGFIPADQCGFIGTAIKQHRVMSVRFSEMGCAGRNANVWARLVIKMRDEREGPDKEDEKRPEPLTVEDEDGRVYTLDN